MYVLGDLSLLLVKCYCDVSLCVIVPSIHCIVIEFLVWARVAILPRLFTFRGEVVPPFDSLSKKCVCKFCLASQFATGNGVIGCITWSFRTCPTHAYLASWTRRSTWDVAVTEKSVLYLRLLLRRKAGVTDVGFAKASIWIFQRFVFRDVKWLETV